MNNFFQLNSFKCTYHSAYRSGLCMSTYAISATEPTDAFVHLVVPISVREYDRSNNCRLCYPIEFVSCWELQLYSAVDFTPWFRYFKLIQWFSLDSAVRAGCANIGSRQMKLCSIHFQFLSSFIILNDCLSLIESISFLGLCPISVREFYSISVSMAFISMSCAIFNRVKLLVKNLDFWNYIKAFVPIHMHHRIPKCDALYISKSFVCINFSWSYLVFLEVLLHFVRIAVFLNAMRPFLSVIFIASFELCCN